VLQKPIDQGSLKDILGSVVGGQAPPPSARNAPIEEPRDSARTA
jgi:hypothetical protein